LATESSKTGDVTEATAFAAKASPRRSKMSSVAAVVQSVGAKLLIVALNAATGILSARALQPAGRGELAAMILWPVFLAGVLTFGMPAAVTFRLKSSAENQSGLLGAAMVLALLTGALGALVGILFMPAWLPRYSPDVILSARLFALYTPFSAVLPIGRAAFESRGDFASSNRLLVIPPALTLLWLIVLWRTGTLTPARAGLAYVVVQLPPLVWMVHRLWGIYKPSLRSFVKSSRVLFDYGIRAYGVDLCGTLALYVDQALVVRMLAPELMGTYVVALSLSRVLNAFHASVVMVLFPKAVRRSPQTVREMTGRATRMSTLLTACAGVGVVALGPHLLGLLYGREYTGATSVLRILVLEVVLSGATLVLSQAFMALERPGIVTTLHVTGLLLTLPLMLLLVPRLGIVGAGLSLLISTSARLIFVLVSFPLFLNMRAPNIFPKLEDLKFMAAATARTFQFSRSHRVMAAEGAD
jgi:O-antigen/teichoic acid export membrane protein